MPDVARMLHTAVKGQQIEVISFLCTKFLGSGLFGAPMREAMDTGNAELLRVVCKFDPGVVDAELGDDSTINALRYAYSQANAPELVKVLLEAGANPNHPPVLLFAS